MSNNIVTVNVQVQVAPTPATLQQSGAFVSTGGTIEAPGSVSLLTQLSDLTPLLTSPAALTSLTWTSEVVTAVTAAPHGLPVGQTVWLNIAGAVPAAYNGEFACAITSTTQFSFSLINNPGTETTPGTWQTLSAIELTQMATTFFAQGSSQCGWVLELGANSVGNSINTLASYIAQNPNSGYTPGSEGYFYSYLVPREWDSFSQLLSLIAEYESPTSRTYFWVTTNIRNYVNYTDLMKSAFTLIECPLIDQFPANALTAISYSNGLVVAETTTNHGVSVGSWFTIAGCTPAGYNGTFQALLGTGNTTLLYNLGSNPGAESVLGTLETSFYPAGGIPATEFTLAAPFYRSLNYNPSTTNKVAPFAFGFVYGVTPFPTYGFSALLSELKAGFTNVIETGAEGGISNTAIFWGTTEDGNDFTYWYSVDWMQITLDLNTANAIINGSNNSINPLYYNQPGIDTLQAVAASTVNQGITYGLVQGNVIQTALDGPVLDQNLSDGLYVDQSVVDAVPFVTYSLENPGDYKIGRYAGLAVIYMPLRGFTNIVYEVVVTELVAQ